MLAIFFPSFPFSYQGGNTNANTFLWPARNHVIWLARLASPRQNTVEQVEIKSYYVIMRETLVHKNIYDQFTTNNNCGRDYKREHVKGATDGPKWIWTLTVNAMHMQCKRTRGNPALCRSLVKHQHRHSNGYHDNRDHCSYNMGISYQRLHGTNKRSRCQAMTWCRNNGDVGERPAPLSPAVTGAATCGTRALLETELFTMYYMCSSLHWSLRQGAT